MRVLFDLLHPAHFHLFKHVIAELRGRGDDVEIIARQKDCLPDLLAPTGWPVHLIPRRGRGSLFTLARESFQAAVLAARLARRRPIDLMVGTSISIGPAARMTGSVSLLFEEDDAKAVPAYGYLGYPLAHYAVTPDCLAFENHGRKHLMYHGYHELAYLHPRRFTPDPAVRALLGVEPGERFFLVRLVALRAHHDIGQAGLSTSQARQVVERMARHGRVFISAEAVVHPDLKRWLCPVPPTRMHDVLAEADFVVGDSQTMAAEAAVLGTPSLRCNTFVGRLAYLEELEHRYDLTHGFLPRQFDELLERLDCYLETPDLKVRWRSKRQRMLDETVDLTDWILACFDQLVMQRQRTSR